MIEKAMLAVCGGGIPLLSRLSRLGLCIFINCFLFAAVLDEAEAQSASGAQSASDRSRTTVRPSFQVLRFNEDYSFLGESDSGYEADFFDPVKFVPLGRAAWLQFGGELRFRYEEETNKFLAPGPQSADGFLLTRLALHMDVRIRNRGRLFVEGIHGDVYDRDEVLFFIHRNRLDLHQLFFDVEVPVSSAILRIGRQEMAYGSEHVISASGWGRMRKRFDAVKLISKGDLWEFSAWFARPVVTEVDAADRQDRDVDFAGAYLKGVNTGLDVYYLYQQNRLMRRNPNGNEGSHTLHTVGGRFQKSWQGIDIEFEVAAQPYGKWAGDDVRAWSIGAGGGYTFLSSRRRPRIGFGLEVASGDDDPLDNKVNTFDQLYRQEKDHLGYLVMYGRQNVQAFNVNAKIGLIPRKVLLEIFHYWFALQSGTDSIYNPGARALPGRRDVTGQGGRGLGRELDLVLGWQVDPHHSVLVGYLHYWKGDFIRATGDVTAPGNVFMQYKLMF